MTSTTVRRVVRGAALLALLLLVWGACSAIEVRAPGYAALGLLAAAVLIPLAVVVLRRQS